MPSSSSPSAAERLRDEERLSLSSQDIESSKDSDAPDVIAPEARNDPSHAQVSTLDDGELSDSDKPDKVSQEWLNAQCKMITGTSLGLVVDAVSDAADVQLLASWPQSVYAESSALIPAARRAFLEQKIVIIPCDKPDCSDSQDAVSKCCVAMPLITGEDTGRVAVFELPSTVMQQQQAISQLLQWGAVWYGLLQRQSSSSVSNSRINTVVEMLLCCLEHSQFNEAATTLVTRLAVSMSCTRVSLGLVHDSSVVVSAISNSARVGNKSNLSKDIGAAMNEAVDQYATLTWPQQRERLPHITHAQEVLAQHAGATSVMSTPLYDNSIAIGALTFERDNDENIDQKFIDMCESLAALLGPVIALKRDKEQSVLSKMHSALREKLERLCGPGHLSWKIYSLVLLCTVAFFSIATTDYRVTAQARLEGSVKRVITAPLSGFVASANHRAGDIVNAGDLLARLDDRELLLEQLQLNSQREQLDTEHRAAMTSHDRSATAIVAARKRQTSAKMALIEEQLARTQLTAPFDGMVVSGDLTQSIGSPVENGQVLFEIAPLDSYRVVLEVDERDIGDILETQSGFLTLTGLPDTKLAFSVNRIVPLSTPRHGRNVFEVQAELDQPNAAIRPGMEGIGKIEVDRRKLIWVWTHKFVSWFRLSVWTWIS